MCFSKRLKLTTKGLFNQIYSSDKRIFNTFSPHSYKLHTHSPLLYIRIFFSSLRELKKRSKNNIKKINFGFSLNFYTCQCIKNEIVCRRNMYVYENAWSWRRTRREIKDNFFFEIFEFTCK